jgi:uncharacterized protein YcfL
MEAGMKKTLLLMTLAAFLILGCGPYRASTHKDPLQETEKIVMLDHVLTRYLNIVKQGANRLPGGQLQVKVEMENEENDDIWTDIKVIFRGQDGFELESTDWEPFMFHRRTVTTFKRNSLNAAAADYRILIRNIRHR